MTKPICKCKGCDKRTINCHDKCKDYWTYKRDLAKYNLYVKQNQYNNRYRGA